MKRSGRSSKPSTGANAQQALADGTMSQADALDLAGRWTDAGAKYAEAFSIFTSLGDSTLPAELGIWSHYRQAAPPLLEFYNNPSRRTRWPCRKMVASRFLLATITRSARVRRHHRRLDTQLPRP